MEDKYLPSLERRKEILWTQIDESRTIIYRQELEIHEFKAAGEKNRIEEAEINVRRLKEKIDRQLKEWDKLSEESLSNYENRRYSALPGPTIQPNV